MSIDSYNWNDYINRYEDLQKANILTREEAVNHWIMYGVHENWILKLINNDLNGFIFG